MCPFKKWPLSLSHSNYFPFYCIFETILVWSAVRKPKSCYRIPHRVWTTCLKKHLILIARYVKINSVIPISQMAWALCGCNREQSLSNLFSLMQYHTRVLLEREKKEKEEKLEAHFVHLFLLNVIMTNGLWIISRSTFCSNNKKNRNYYMQIWDLAKKKSKNQKQMKPKTKTTINKKEKPKTKLPKPHRSFTEPYLCYNFSHGIWEETYFSKPFTETISKLISLTHVPHISWQGKYSRFCFLSSFNGQNIIPPSQLCHHAELLSKQV